MLTNLAPFAHLRTLGCLKLACGTLNAAGAAQRRLEGPGAANVALLASSESSKVSLATGTALCAPLGRLVLTCWTRGAAIASSRDLKSANIARLALHSTH
eukprot:3843542-Prymnesium_polylepis.1